jgi:phosphate regulon transcriptional regulator PhoB
MTANPASAPLPLNTMEMKKILVVDDEPDLVELVSYNLRKEGFKVSSASNGEDALEKVRKGGYDLIILDLMLPGIQGVELCRMIRSDPKIERVPIIMLTARGELKDKIRGLETGADDYMTKPFSPRELVARVNTVLRRISGRLTKEKVIRMGELIIDLETYTVTKRDTPLRLSATEFKLLLYLAERKGRVFSRDQLLDAVWKDESFVEPRTVDVHIRRLRTQIEDDPSDPVHIKTRRGVGYYVE